MLKINLKNCNNVSECEIDIKKDLLNIFYAMNGTGKSTIGKALELLAKDETRSEEHTSELQSHSFISYAVFCLKKKKIT